MPFPFQVILVAGATGFLLTATLFLVMRGMSRANPGAGWWALSSIAAGCGYIVLLLLARSGDPATGEALYNSLFVIWVAGLNLGGCYFLGRRARPMLLLMSGSLLLLWLLWFYFIDPAFLPAAIAVSLFVGLLNLRLAWLFHRHHEERGALHWSLVAALALSGLHWLDYPLLRPVEWFAPIGFALCAILAVVINSLLAAMILRQFRQRLLVSEQQALQAASCDPLTGLSNRLALDKQFEQALALAERHGQGLALLFIDLDGFKAINDEFGHEAGDRVLLTVARRLERGLRRADIVARLGGDEFVVIYTELSPSNRSQAERLAEELLATIDEPIDIGFAECRVQASVGIAYAPQHGTTLNHLMLAADKAMYEVKETGKNGYRVAASALSSVLR